MSSPESFSTTILRRQQPHREVCFIDSTHFCCDVRVLCVRPSAVITSLNFTAILSTGDLYSVVFPFEHKEDIAILSQEIPVSMTPTWIGIPCKVVQLRIGLQIQESAHPRPLTMTALLPLDPDAIPDDVPPLLRIGAEFLYRNKAAINLPSTAAEGNLLIPF